MKKKYDEILKQLQLEFNAINANKSDFRCDQYAVYFSDETFKSEILANMNRDDKKAYGTGAGGELKDAKDGRPAKMKSVASSSRFCYLSLKDTDFKVFDINHSNRKKRRFEEKMPILKGGYAPHIDCYIENGDELVCFECKCHEQFDSHRIELSNSYFTCEQNLLVQKIEEKYHLKTIERKGKKTYFYRVISPKLLGIESEILRFDVKQFLTHIMGIQKKLEESEYKKARLIYYYFIPEKVIKKYPDIKKVICETIKEAKTAFNSAFIKDNVKNLSFELYVQCSDVVESANDNNTKRIIPKED